MPGRPAGVVVGRTTPVPKSKEVLHGFTVWSRNPQTLFTLKGPKSSDLKVGRRGRRLGISEIVGSVLAIALTIIAGSAVFGYVNAQANTTEKQYGSSVGATINYLQEQYGVVDISFTSSTQVTLYVYNYGRVPLSLVQAIVYNSTQAIYVVYTPTQVASTKPSVCTVAASLSNESPLLWSTATNSGMNVTEGYVSTLTLTLPACSGASFVSGTTYTVKLTGLYGNTVAYSQVKS